MAEPDAKERDTKELDALLDSVNGSAERFQTLWFSFLGLTLYLAIAALATTHRNLLLGEPQTLPILNIKVELLPFYVIAPLLYLVFHFYLLMMLVLLARTAAEFDKRLRTTILDEADRERYRAKVDNALFLQLLVGMKGERSGVNAFLLGLIALITIVLAPLATLILMQMMFLPYHSFRITWWHRGIVVADLGLVLIMWQGFFYDSGIDNPLLFFRDRPHLRRRLALAANLGAIAVAMWLSIWEGRWAGEPGPGRTKLDWPGGVVWGLFPDRLFLPAEAVVDEERIGQVEKGKGPSLANFYPHETAPPTRDLSGRDLQGAFLAGADLRGVDLTRAKLREANLTRARLEGAELFGADLRGANLAGASLHRTDLRSALLQGCQLVSAQLQGAELSRSHLAGANLNGAQLQGATLRLADLRAVDLENAQMQGADLRAVDLRAASLVMAELQGATFGEGWLNLDVGFPSSRYDAHSRFLVARLEGAALELARLQGANLRGADLALARVSASVADAADVTDANLLDLEIEIQETEFDPPRQAGPGDPPSQDKHALPEAPPTSGPPTSITGITKADVDDWMSAATEFASPQDADEIRGRFRLLLSLMRPGGGEARKAPPGSLEEDESKTLKLGALREATIALGQDRPNPEYDNRKRKRLAELYGDLACDAENAPYVARAFVERSDLGGQLEGVRARMKAAREKPDSCKGVAGFTEDDWRALDAPSP